MWPKEIFNVHLLYFAFVLSVCSWAFHPAEHIAIQGKDCIFKPSLKIIKPPVELWGLYTVINAKKTKTQIICMNFIKRCLQLYSILLESHIITSLDCCDYLLEFCIELLNIFWINFLVYFLFSNALHCAGPPANCYIQNQKSCLLLSEYLLNVWVFSCYYALIPLLPFTHSCC